MTRFRNTMLLAMLAATPALLQAQGKGGKGHDGGQKHEYEQQKREHERGGKREHDDRDDDRDHDRDGDRHHAQAPNGTHHDVAATHRPPGWDRGNKTGWNGRNLPPGQAKKRRATSGYDVNRRTTTRTTTTRPPVIWRKPTATSTSRTTTTTTTRSTRPESEAEMRARIQAAAAAAKRSTP